MTRQHLETILWLRWRLTANQWSRSGGLGGAIAVFVGVGSLFLGGASFLGSLVGGLALRSASAVVIETLWFGLVAGFLLFWMVGVIAELQRSESIDLQKLLHLPVSLVPMFLVNYLASHLSLTLAIAVPAMIGLSVGLAIARGAGFLLLIPLSLSLVFMVTAWTYCLRGWLAAMIGNPRRRRAVIVGLTFSVVMMGQIPNLYFNVLHPVHHTHRSGATREDRRAADHAEEEQVLTSLRTAERFAPPFWVSLGARQLTQGRSQGTLLGILGFLALGAAGLMRAYRGTLRLYQGVTGSSAAAPGAGAATETADPRARAREPMVADRLRGVPEPAAAVAMATLQSMLRAPEVQMLWATSALVIAILGSTIVVRLGSHLRSDVRPAVLCGALALALFMQVQWFANPFGFDRDGFRSLVLSPVERHLILLGKNLAFFPVTLVLGSVLLAGGAIWFQLGPLTVLATFLQLVTMLLIAAVAGNLLGILSPYRVASGSLKPTKMPAQSMLVLVVCQMFFPLALSPALFPSLAQLLWDEVGFPPGIPVALGVALAMAGAAAAVYALTLKPLGRLLQRREQLILGRVTLEVE